LLEVERALISVSLFLFDGLMGEPTNTGSTFPKDDQEAGFAAAMQFYPQSSAPDFRDLAPPA
jgi:hypothetical protein